MESLKTVEDITMVLTAEIGTTLLTVQEISELTTGSVIEVNKPAGASIDIFVNKTRIGEGEVLVFEKNLAVRISDIVSSRTI